MYPYIRQNPLIVLGAIAFINIVIAFTYVNHNSGSYIINPLEFNSDTRSYLTTIEFFRESLTGHSDEAEKLVTQPTLTRSLTTPLMMFFSMCIGSLTGNDSFGMIAINVIFYFLLVPILYRIGILVLKDKKAAFIATFLVLTNWVLFTFGTTYLVDMGGWFFFLLSTMFGLEYFKDTSNKRAFYYAILASIVGVFFKEYGALGMVTLGLLVCLERSSYIEKCKKLITAGLLFGVTVFLYHLWFYFTFQYSYFGWYNFNYDQYASTESLSNKYNIKHLIRIIALIFLVGWPLFLLGVRRFMKERWDRTHTQTILALSAMLPASLAFLAWPAFTHRISFILIPWVALVTAVGLAPLKNKWIVIFLLIYVLFNYNVDVLTAGISIP